LTSTGPRRALVLRFGDRTLIAPTAELRALVEDVDTAGTVDLAALAGAQGAAPGARPVGLVVAIGGRRVILRAVAAVEIADVDEIYDLPHVLRGGGCAAWVRGLALVPGATGEPAAVATWVDLPAIARRHVADEITEETHGESRERTP
jgi:hypothetical protein